MATQAAISMEEYLRTSYEYDPEYVDGALVGRSSPTTEHGRILIFLGYSFLRVLDQCRLYTAADVRLPLLPTRSRVPDLSIFDGGLPKGRYPSTAPLAVIEILSPEDSHRELMAKLREYRGWGVGFIWVIDPEDRVIHIYENGSLIAVDAIEIASHNFRLPAAEIFA